MYNKNLLLMCKHFFCETNIFDGIHSSKIMDIQLLESYFRVVTQKKNVLYNF